MNPEQTINGHTVHMCAKFKPFRTLSSGEKCDGNVQCLKIGEREKIGGIK